MSELIYINDVGKIYENKVEIGTSKFYYDQFESINFIKEKNNAYNYTALALALTCFFLSYKNYFKEFYFLIIFILLGIFFFIIYILCNKCKYFIKINLVLPDERKIFSIKKQHKEDAKEFIILVEMQKNYRSF